MSTNDFLKQCTDSCCSGCRGIWALRNTVASAIVFFPGFWYHDWRYGASFTFNPIAGDPIKDEDVCNDSICIGFDKKILTRINDGKSTPLALGSIARTEKNITQLKKAFDLSDSDSIAFFSCNRPFERRWSGLENVIKKDDTITLKKYPTTDFCPPSLIDLIRIVLDLDNRDSLNTRLVYLQCTAGGGRSVTAAAAYLLYIFMKADIDIEHPLKHIKNYLQSRRAEYNLNDNHEAGLMHFQDFLITMKNQGKLSKLDQVCARAITDRVKQVKG